LRYGSAKAQQQEPRKGRIGRVSLALLALVLVGFTAWWIASGIHHSSSSLDGLNSDPTPASSSENPTLGASSFSSASPTQGGRVVYPYSVVPGGVRSPEDLHQASVRDRVVGQHFSGFNFSRAKVVELDQPRLVYLSYRIGNKVFWTKKQVHLRKGEKLISDGIMSARTRCANQVSTLPKKAISALEPPAEAFEDPYGAGDTSRQIPFPGNFESALFNRELAAFDPQGPPGSPLFGPGSSVGLPGVYPPPIPSAGCDPTKEQCSPPPPPPPTPVPEPGSIVLISSGLLGIYLRYRKMR
jgi:PEP-CTERM motif-containing protein